MKKALEKAKREAKRAGDNVVAAVKDGTVEREAQRIAKQISNATEVAGGQIADVAEVAAKQVRDAAVKAKDQAKELAIRSQTNEQREAANKREAASQEKLEVVLKKLPKDFSQDNEDLKSLRECLVQIKNLAEKIRSRDQEEHSDYPFKDEISKDHVQDCKNWLLAQEELEQKFDVYIVALEKQIPAPGLEQSAPAVAVASVSFLPSFDSLSKAFSAILVTAQPAAEVGKDASTAPKEDLVAKNDDDQKEDFVVLNKDDGFESSNNEELQKKPASLKL